uniref:Uncharacterized protein n=1 Tax=viral metagenome TaxID=1070528 RepID=A0A6H1ZWS2_9ZZZZ
MEMTFEKWWSRHAIEQADILPVLKLSFKELAKSAWEAALYLEDEGKVNLIGDEITLDNDESGE